MQLCRSFHHLPFFKQGCAITVGNFDGVHSGHAALLQRLSAKAQSLQLPRVVMIFEPQPREVLTPALAPVRLTSFYDKIQLLKQQPVDYVICLHFNTKIAGLTPEEFVQKILVQQCHAKYILVGDDFRFGKQRQGNFELLQTLAPKFHFLAEAMPDLQLEQQRVSSTLIRETLNKGDLKLAEKMLGHAYFATGKVRQGAGRGRQWGFPTANLHIPPKGLAVKGVFTVWVSNDQLYQHPAVANIGTRPTVDGTKPVLEVLLLNFSGDLYGKRLRVEFLHKLRDEQRFADLDSLIAQIQKDVADSKAFFNF